MSHKPSIIAIDGTAASGKTTLALKLANHLGYLYFDTGMMYRAVTYAALERDVALTDETAVSGIAEQIRIDVKPPTVDDGRPATVCVDGKDVTWELREAVIDARVSIVSAYREVRAEMTRQQRRIAERGCMVMVGRDIGTVVLPEADLKIYLDASVEERAQRRWRDYQATGHENGYDEILRSMRERDRIDSERPVAPLRPADDAHVINTTHNSAEAVLAQVLEWVEAYGQPSDEE